MYIELVIFSVFAFLYSLIAHRIEKLPISGPVIFLIFGYLIGPYGFSFLQAPLNETVVRILADFTLAIFLFVDAAKTHTKILNKSYQLPLRMLLIGLPLSILLGFFAAFIFNQTLNIYEMALLAVMLAATDAALGKPVVESIKLPERLRVSLNIESGLNDGLCVPLLLFFIALASTSADAHSSTSALELIIHELGIGLIVGILVSLVGAWLLDQASKHHWLSGAWAMIPTIMLALSCFGLAQELGGSGYIAAFVGGFAYRMETGEYRKQLLEEADGFGEILAMATWIIVGSFIIGKTLPLVSWSIIFYSILSLTIIRIIPILLSLIGTGEKLASKLFIGWFGPRGLASIVFAFIVLESKVPNADFIATVVIFTVFLSAILHGISAVPLTNKLAKILKE